MPKVLFAHTFLDPRGYSCEARVGFDRAEELREFLERNTAPNAEAGQVAISYQPRTGYDGTPVYQADVHISKPSLLAERPEFRVSDRELEQGYAGGSTPARPDTAARAGLSWEQRQRFRKETTAILRQLGVTDLGYWK